MSEPRRPRLELLCGMIASGKSTYARDRADQGAILVCHDTLTESLHGRYRYEPELKPMYRRMEEALVLVALGAGRDVVVDRTHLTRESRGRWRNFLDDHRAMLGGVHGVRDVELVAVHFPVELPEVHALRRFNHDARGRTFEEWLAVATHHHQQAEAEPLEWRAEGFDAEIECGPCPACDATGGLGEPCHVCKGTGRVREYRCA